MRQKYFESANKTGKLLAWQLRKRQNQNIINKIRIGEDQTEDPKEIRKAFQGFYKELYRKEKDDIRKVEKYLEEHKGKQISAENREQLNNPITIQEIQNAIKRMKLGNAPGPDGLSTKYYKTLCGQLTPVLCEVMNNILQGGNIPNTWKEVYITLIPKQEADPSNVKNYRPISLLNNDYKLFSDILANRLKQILKEVIHKDQAGFLPERQLKDNVRHIVNVIEYLEVRNEKPAALMFIDAEKAAAALP